MSQGLASRTGAHGASALSGGRRRPPSPWLVSAGLFWLAVSLAFWRVPLCCGAGRHAAAVERLIAHPLRPAHPAADLPGAGSPAYSPYTLLEALAARTTGLTGREATQLAGPLVLLVLLTGLGRLVRAVTARPWAPVLALAATVLLWGTRAVTPGGGSGLLPLTVRLSAPATLAIGLTLWAWAWAIRRGSGPVSASDAGLGVLCAAAGLVAPVLFLPALAGTAACLVARGGPRRSITVRCALIASAAAVVAVCWPYYDLFALLGDAGPDAVRSVSFGGLTAGIWLAFLGLPALWLRLRRDRRDPLVLLCVPGWLLLGYGWATGPLTQAPVLALALLPSQLALGVELAAPRPWPPRRRALAFAAVAGAGAGFLSAQAGAVVPRALDPLGFPQPPHRPTYEWAARHIAPGEVVLTDGRLPLRSLPAYGPDVVAPALPDPALDERTRRQRLDDVRAYLDPGSTRVGRMAVARRYHVHWLLLEPDQRLPPEATVVAWSTRTGEVLAKVNGGAPRER